MSENNLNPIWPGVTYQKVELGFVALLFVLGIFLIWQSVILGIGYGGTGPEPGLWPFSLVVLYMVGNAAVLLFTLRNPDTRPFFEVTQEVKDLAAVGAPILVSVLLIPWLGIFVTSAVYLAFFMAWYGRFGIIVSIVSGIVLGAVLWFLLRMGFNLSMPMSYLYYQNITPF